MTTSYRAYISYSHADSRFAAWLQRALESYRPPKSLAASSGPTPIKPVFLDRSDLRSASDLGEALVEALDHSLALIVVCSRHAASSRWVNEEIRRFRDTHGNAQIFPVIVADDPPDCFPAALLGDGRGETYEPMAADARREGDGRRDAFLKLAAALLDVEFDQLKRRELRQQYRRMSAVAASTTVVATAMLGLAIMAYDARDRADRRSAQAEDLIGFMLGDLRTRLEPIGRLDVLDAVGDKATEYYSSLTASELTPESQLGRAQALRQIGEVRMAQGDLASAGDAFAASNRQALSLTLEYPQNLKALFELSQSHFWVGYVDYLRNDVEAARTQFELYLGIAERLVELSPDNLDYAAEVAYAHSNLGTMEVAENNYLAANLHFGKTAEYQYQRLAEDPESAALKFDLAETLSWLGTVARDSLSINEAINRFEAELSLRRDIMQTGPDKRSEEKFADAALLLAHQLLLAGRFGEARARILESLRVSDALVAHDPGNADWKRLQAFVAVELSRIEATQMQLENGLRWIVPALETLRQLADDDVDNARRGADLVTALEQYARLLRMSGNDAAALSAVDEALALVSGDEDGRPAPELASKARLYLLRGDLLADARSSGMWREGLLSLDGISDSVREPSGLLTRAALMERVGELTNSRALRDEAARLGYGDTGDGLLSATLIDGYTGKQRTEIARKGATHAR